MLTPTLRERLAALAERLQGASPLPAPAIRAPAPATIAPAPDLVLVSCSDQKVDTGSVRAPASQVYASPLFRLSLAYARSLVPDARIRIVSAAHHVLGVDEPIRSYDYPLGKLSMREREDWGGRVAHMLRTELGSGPRTVMLLAGADYVHAIRTGALGLGWTFVLPFGEHRGERMPIGRRLQWLRRQLDLTGERGAMPPAEERDQLVAFLRSRAGDETRRAPSRNIGAALLQAASLIEQRQLDVHRAIALLHDLAANESAIASPRVHLAARAVARGEHRDLASAERPRRQEPS